MTFMKIENPKASKACNVPPNHVRVSSAKAKGFPYIKVRIGAEVARLCSLTQDQHKVHVHTGSGSDAGKLAISLDDSTGVFTAVKQRDGSYQLTISSGAAKSAGLETEFEPFTVGALARQIVAGPRMIVFEPTPEFLGLRAEAA